MGTRRMSISSALDVGKEPHGLIPPLQHNDRQGSAPQFQKQKGDVAEGAKFAVRCTDTEEPSMKSAANMVPIKTLTYGQLFVFRGKIAGMHGLYEGVLFGIRTNVDISPAEEEELSTIWYTNLLNGALDQMQSDTIVERMAMMADLLATMHMLKYDYYEDDDVDADQGIDEAP